MPTSEDFEALTAEQIATARRLGEENAKRSTRAESIVIDPSTRRAELRLSGGLVLGFDLDAVPELAHADAGQLAETAIDLGGRSISCRPLDVDISVEGLILDLLGPEWKRAMRATLLREASSTRNAATAAAARENGKKGGRPKKAASA